MKVAPQYKLCLYRNCDKNDANQPLHFPQVINARLKQFLSIDEHFIAVHHLQRKTSIKRNLTRD